MDERDLIVRTRGGAERTGHAALRKFVAPEFVFGAGALGMAGRYVRNVGAEKVLLVTDPGVIEAGWAARVERSLTAEGLRVVVFHDVSPNPREHEVMAGADVYRAEGCSAIVAVGGGSPMDCAKGIGIVSTNNAEVLSFEGVDEVAVPGPPLVCVPTTAGTSADVSQFAVINATARHTKVVIVSKTLVPDVALIDPLTTVTMDAVLTAASGLDALTHGIEAYVSDASSPITDQHALAAITLIADHLVVAVRRPDDIVARTQMMLASLHAGLAFSNASLGAVHAMSHGVGGLLDCAHGVANATLLSAVCTYNYGAAPERYRRVATSLKVARPGLRPLLDAIARLREAAGVPWTLRDVGLQPADIPTLAANAMQDACMVTNPRRPTASDIEGLFADAL
jgi:alcohol dehydrogenase class IV